MDRSANEPSFPLELDEQGNLKILALLETNTHLVPGAVILALRCADSPEALDAGGNMTLQIGLSPVQIRGLLETLRNAELVLKTAVNPSGSQH